jgi:hypothetical protein
MDKWCWICISKKHFRPGGMAAAEWTHRIACRTLIASSPFLLAQSVSYFTQTLWRCSQLWPYVGMGLFCTHLHWDCNGMHDAAKNSSRLPSTFSSRSLTRRWEDMAQPGQEDRRNWVDPRNLGLSECDQKLGKIECELSLYDKRRWK